MVRVRRTVGMADPGNGGPWEWRTGIVVQDLIDLVHLLQERGAAKVVLGEILFRGKLREGGPLLEIFNTNVTFVNAKLWEKAHGHYWFPYVEA